MRKSDVSLAALSLVASVLIWASVYNYKNRLPDQQTIQVTLSASGLDESKFAVTAIPESVPLTMAGTADQLRNVMQQAPTAFVYLAGVEAGTKSMPVVVFPPMVRDILVNGSQTARVTIEPLLTKPVDVQVAKVGALPAGTVEEDIDPLPRRVFVRGPAEALKKVSNVLVSINVGEANAQNGEVEVEGKAVDAKGLPVEKILLLVSDDETKYNAVTLAEPFMIRVRIKTGLAPTIP